MLVTMVPMTNSTPTAPNCRWISFHSWKSLCWSSRWKSGAASDRTRAVLASMVGCPGLSCSNLPGAMMGQDWVPIKKSTLDGKKQRKWWFSQQKNRDLTPSRMSNDQMVQFFLKTRCRKTPQASADIQLIWSNAKNNWYPGELKRRWMFIPK